MKCNRVPLFVLLLLAFATAPAAADHRAEDEKAILAVLDRFEEAFEKRDAKLYASNFAEDAIWENAFGGRVEGRAGIEAALTNVYKMFKKADQEILERRVAFITGEVAVAVLTKDIHGQRSMQSQTKLPPRRVRNTSVLRRVGGAWKVAYFEAADIRRDDLPSR